MKNNWKYVKLLALLLTLALVFAGCSKKGKAEAEDPGSVAESVQTDVEDEADVDDDLEDSSDENEKDKSDETEKDAEEDAETEEERSEKEDKSDDSEKVNASDADENSETTNKLEIESVEVIKNETPANDEFVRVKDYIPDMVVDLKYATSDNFTGEVIYDFKEAYLRYGTVKKLAEVQSALKDQGMGLKIWDAYRPVYAQQRLWDVYPDPVYVANPANGVGGHCLGGTIDITLVYLDGSDVVMPTGFDDFSVKANRDYSDCTEEERNNALILENIMYEHGFTGYAGEWWDFTDTDGYWSNADFMPPAE